MERASEDPEFSWIVPSRSLFSSGPKMVKKTGVVVPPAGMRGYGIAGHSVKVFDDGTRTAGPYLDHDEESIDGDEDDIGGDGVGGEVGKDSPSDYIGAPPVGYGGGVLSGEEKTRIRDFHEKLNHTFKFSREEWDKPWPKPGLGDQNSTNSSSLPDQGGGSDPSGIPTSDAPADPTPAPSADSPNTPTPTPTGDGQTQQTQDQQQGTGQSGDTQTPPTTGQASSSGDQTGAAPSSTDPNGQTAGGEG